MNFCIAKPNRLSGRRMLLEDLDVYDPNWNQMYQLLKDLEVKFHNQKFFAQQWV